VLTYSVYILYLLFYTVGVYGSCPTRLSCSHQVMTMLGTALYCTDNQSSSTRNTRLNSVTHTVYQLRNIFVFPVEYTETI